MRLWLIKRDATLSYLVGMRLWLIQTRLSAFEALHAISLGDLVGSFNAKSALTVEKPWLWIFPEQQSMCLLHTGFDIHAGIKADGFDFYAINYKPYGLPINRPQPFNSPLSRLFFFASMRSEGLRLDCLPSLQGHVFWRTTRTQSFHAFLQFSWKIFTIKWFSI